MRVSLAAAALVALVGTGAASAQDFQPAIIFDMGGKFDKSFNEAAYLGAERFREETGIDYLEFEITNEAQREQALIRMATRGGADVVIGVGFAFTSPMEKIAPEHPETMFVIIDSVVEGDNVRSIVFEEHEGSFLVGMAAALASETGTVGFVGGMDVPLIRNFLHGYQQGVRYVRPDATILANMTGDTPAAWNDPTKGAELAQSQFDRGADVVYHAAGATGLGVLQAAADNDKLGIGVDSNQNHLHPGNVLTSMLKRVDVAVYETFMAAMKGELEGGLSSLGLAENGVGFALDEHNEALFTADMIAQIEAAEADIIAGVLEVEDYYATQQ